MDNNLESQGNVLVPKGGFIHVKGYEEFPNNNYLLWIHQKNAIYR